MARMELDYSLKNLGYIFEVVSARLQKSDVNGRGSFS